MHAKIAHQNRGWKWIKQIQRTTTHPRMQVRIDGNEKIKFMQLTSTQVRIDRNQRNKIHAIDVNIVGTKLW